MGRVNSPGAGKITDEALLSHTNPLIGISFFLVIGKEGAWVCYRKGRQRHRMAKRGGSAGKEWEIVKDDFFVAETKGAKKASDSLSRSGFPTPR